MGFNLSTYLRKCAIMTNTHRLSVLRRLNPRDKNDPNGEPWLCVEFDRPIRRSTRPREIASQALGRPPGAIMHADQCAGHAPANSQDNAYWAAGPITEEEAQSIKESTLRDQG